MDKNKIIASNNIQDVPLSEYGVSIRGVSLSSLSPPFSVGSELVKIEEHSTTEDATNDEQTIKGEKEKSSANFWPEKPKMDSTTPVKASTVLTNLQRGNVPTLLRTVVEPVVGTLHQRAGRGEIRATELQPEPGGAFVDEKDERGQTPLIWSSAYGHTPTVSLLLRHGADVNAHGYENEFAIHLAAANGHHEVVRILLNHGADVNALDENSCSPLMFAAINNYPHCVHELLIHGANVALTNINGQSALSLAIAAKATNAQIVLENHLVSLLRGLGDNRQDD